MAEQDQPQDQTEGTQISPQDAERVRALLDKQTKWGRVCLRMLDHGESVYDASAKEGVDPIAVMRDWHRLTDDNGIRCVDGRRPCISTLANDWKRRWEAPAAPMWEAVEAPFSPQPFIR